MKPRASRPARVASLACHAGPGAVGMGPQPTGQHTPSWHCLCREQKVPLSSHSS